MKVSVWRGGYRYKTVMLRGVICAVLRAAPDIGREVFTPVREASAAQNNSARGARMANSARHRVGKERSTYEEHYAPRIHDPDGTMVCFEPTALY